MSRAEAQKLIDKGRAIIPLFPNQKKNHDSDILTKRYKAEEVKEDDNVGINLLLSDPPMYAIDPDTDWAIKFAEKWLPRDTTINGRINDGKKELTKFFYESDDSIKENIKDRKDSSGETICELYYDHNIVVDGSTPNKQTGRLMKRYWEKESPLKPFNQGVLDTFNLICFASAVAPHLKSANTGALKLDSCLMRYTDWSDEKREQVLLDILSVAMPSGKTKKGEKEVSEATPQKMRRIIRANNRQTKNAGYSHFADYIKVDRMLVRSWFNWIGEVPEEKSKYTKSYRDFVNGGIDMKALMTKEIPPMKWAVQPILPEGLVIMAGVPKAMKSWKCLLLSYAVRNGFSFLEHNVPPGDVLYLALEDSERRLKDRVKKLGLDNMPNHPDVDTEAPYLGMGLEESLQDWIDEVKNPRLIIIDTLAKVKQRTSKKSGTAYDHDNEMLRDIQKLAIKNGICILFVSHLSKASQDYSWDRIQGSVGMQGITDAMWMLDRGDVSGQASLIGRGRDIMDFEYSLMWNPDTWRYTYSGQLHEVNTFENRQEIIVAIRELEKGGITEFTPKDVCNHYAIAPNTKEARRLQKNMLRMKDQQSLVQGSKYGTYKIAPRLTADNIEAKNIEERDANKIAVANEKKRIAEKEKRISAYGTNPGDRLFE